MGSALRSKWTFSLPLEGGDGYRQIRPGGGVRHERYNFRIDRFDRKNLRREAEDLKILDLAMPATGST